MNGLGIVLEEKSESLLPPLPSEPQPAAAEQLSNVSSPATDVPEVDFYTNSNSSFSTYELNSPSINLENNQLFPSVSESPKDTSPLKRLKSIKHTIRKLSLSKPEPHRKSSHSKHDRPAPNPIQSHAKNPSTDSNESYKFKCITPTTPPLSSPIITLTENLTFDDVDKNILNIQQAFLDNYKISSDELACHLMPYHAYLANERTLIDDSFTATKNRLIKSGWCSPEDLEKLQAQRVRVLAKIDQTMDAVELQLSNEL